ncbi:translation initiation factor [Sulfurovum sp.]|uniref:translation initiation factor n=1 Tax=Sulfurovum sp. TaxID=1969726 RepID=UPI0026000F10|nr:translation initiation factor [Sulfurovum sp.]
MAKEKKNLFEINTDFDEGWQADNKKKKEAEEPSEIKIPEKHRLCFAKEKRRGKTVTIVKPFYLETGAIKQLLKQLKSKLGTGGTVKDNSLEFQGELQEKLRSVLKQLGYGLR